MFGEGNFFEIEGEHVNVFSLEDASAELGLVPDSAVKGFIYQTVTSLHIEVNSNHAAPPSVLALGVTGALALAGLLGACGAAFAKRDRSRTAPSP